MITTSSLSSTVAGAGIRVASCLPTCAFTVTSLLTTSMPRHADPRPERPLHFGIRVGEEDAQVAGADFESSDLQGIENANVAPGPSFDAAHKRPRCLSMMD